MNTLSQEYFRSARGHLKIAKGFKSSADQVRMRMFYDWAQQDHAVARRILREARP